MVSAVEATCPVFLSNNYKLSTEQKVKECEDYITIISPFPRVHQEVLSLVDVRRKDICVSIRSPPPHKKKLVLNSFNVKGKISIKVGGGDTSKEFIDHFTQHQLQTVTTLPKC